MSHSELALWLESEADYKDGLANGAIEYATTLAHAEYHNDARQANSRAARLRKHAADLRAAAQAVRAIGPIPIESDEPSKSDEVTVLKKLLKESTQKLKQCQERLAYVTEDLNATTDRAVGYLKKIEERES